VTDPPTLGEVIRRLEALQTTIERHQGQYISRNELLLTLVPITDRITTVNDRVTTVAGDVDEIQQGEKDRVKEARTWRQQVMLVVLAFMLTNLALIAVKVSELLT
jgi:hypothetical protein